MDNKRFTYRKVGALLFIVIIFSSLKMSFARQDQDIKVTGKVTDKMGQPLIGVSVTIKGTNTSTATAESGLYSINAVDAKSIIVFTYIGFVRKEMPLAGQNLINVTLLEDSQSLEEVVVTGYGTQKRSDLTGSIASIPAEQLLKSVSPTPQAALAGKVAGVRIDQRTAQPGAGMSMSIRGGGSPLIVIDGFPNSGGVTAGTGNNYNSPSPDGFNFVNPDDIESIEILKDAAATSIYGARGSNGVVLITTKKGKRGKAQINFSSKLGVQNRINDVNLLGGKQFGTQVNEFRQFLGQQPLYENDFLNGIGEGTNWVSEISRDGIYNDNQINMSGGEGRTQYYISGNLYDNRGVIKNSDFKKYSGRVNLNHVGEKYRVSINANYALLKNNGISSNTGGQNENASLLQLARQFSPLIPVRDADGAYAINPNVQLLANPVSMLEVTDYQETNNLLSNASVEYDLAKGLFGRVEVGLENQMVERSSYVPRSTVNGARLSGQANISDNSVNNTRLLTSLNFKRDFSKHSINSLIGYENQSYLYKGRSLGGTDFPTDALLYYNLGLGNPETNYVGSSQSRVKWVSYLGRANYAYNNKYLLTATFRYDGSPKFQEGNRFKFYPSVSAGWRLEEENFIKNLNTFSQLKLRASWGQTGQDNFNLGDAIPLLGLSKIVFGNQEYFAAGQNNLTNPNLQWQTTTETNVGLDFGIFNSRLTGTFDVYSRIISDLLFRRATDPEKGYTNAPVNLGKQANKGWELSLDYKVLTGRVKWNTAFNVFQNTYSWADRQDKVTPLLYRGENDPLDAIYAYKVTGVIKDASQVPSSMPNAKPGMWIFEDINGRDANGNFVNQPDGKITSDDQVYMGTSQPRWNWGFSSYLDYKRFNFNFAVQAMMDRKAYNNARAYFAWPYRLVDAYQNMSAEVLERWTPANTNAPLASGETNPYGDATYNSYFIDDASFVRIKNITLSYQVPVKKIIAINSLNIFLDVNNPVTITKYNGYDPETGLSLDPYPNVRTYSIGINVGL